MKNKNIIGAILITIAITSCLATIVIIMQGETKISGQKPDDIIGQSLTCESKVISYPFSDYDNSIRKNLKITAIFYNDILNAISLTYTLYYNNADQVKASEASVHADMNISFGKNGLKADALNANYSKTDNTMRMAIYSNANDIDNTTAKYFMINTENNVLLPKTLAEYQQNYTEQGFICELNN